MEEFATISGMALVVDVDVSPSVIALTLMKRIIYVLFLQEIFNTEFTFFCTFYAMLNFHIVSLGINSGKYCGGCRVWGCIVWGCIA